MQPQRSENGQPLTKSALKKLEKERLKKEKAEKGAAARAQQAAQSSSAVVSSGPSSILGNILRLDHSQLTNVPYYHVSVEWF
jgi:hypothetical protein